MTDIDQAISSARVRLKAGRLDEVAAIHHLLTVLRPDDADGWYRLGHVLIEQGRPSLAAPCFHEALKIAPGHAAATHELTRLTDQALDRAQAAENAGRRADAVTALGEAMLLNPGDDRPRQALLRHALADMPEAAAEPSAGEVDGYRYWLLHREIMLGQQRLQAGDADDAHTRFGRVAALATDAEGDMRRIGVAGREATRRPSPAVATPTPGTLPGDAHRLADQGRVEEAVRLLRRAMPLGKDVNGTRDSYFALRAKLHEPGKRIMTGVGPVDLAIDGNFWSFTPDGARYRALALSIPALVVVDDEDMRVNNHGTWEVRQVVRSLLAAGFAVDVSLFGKDLPASLPDYDLAYSLQGHLADVAGRLSPRTLKIVWETGSSPDYQNRREQERVAALAARGRQGYVPQRVADVAREFAAMDIADRCIVLGNAHTLSTFAPERQKKSTLLLPTASRLARMPVVREGSGPPEFLWIGGGGAVLKGLDLVLEAFATMPECTLHVVGFPADEPGFDGLYAEELYRRPNIRFHGYLRTAGPEFLEIVERCSAFVAPSASEGGSTAAATCLAAGLFPIVSDDTGLDYEEGSVARLAELSVDAVIGAVRKVAAMPHERLLDARRRIQAAAAPLYARERFVRDMDRLVAGWITAIR